MSWVGLSSKHTTGRFGSGASAYKSSTSSMRATYSASTLGMHHMALRQGLRSFAARRRAGTGGGHQQGFFLARQLALRACAWLFAERRLQTHLHEAALGAIDSGAADHHRRGNDLVTQARVDGEQDLRPLELASRLLAACQHRCEFVAFGLVEI